MGWEVRVESWRNDALQKVYSAIPAAILSRSLFVSPRGGADTSLRVSGPKEGVALTVGFSDGVGEVGAGEGGRASGGGDAVGIDM